ncbi:MAG TPA: hypothetical protein VF188_01255 [Longimicrobiales bacterium]
MAIRQRRDGRFDRTGRLRPVVVERVGREAVAGAIAHHKAAGRSIYYADPEHPGFVIEEHADGRRFLLAEDADGRLKRVREIPPR